MRGAGGESLEGEYERYRGAVLGMLAKRFPRLDPDERLAIYHDGWARALAMRKRGEKIRSLRAYLLASAGADALNLVSRGRNPTPVGPDDSRISTLADAAPPPDEQVVTRDQARIARSLLDTLDERQRDVLKLRWDLQLSGSEVQAALGLSERQYRRLAEEGAAALAERVEELQSGKWSQRKRSLLVACLVEVTRDGKVRKGIATPRQRAEAQRLVDEDPHVAALFADVRRTAKRATAFLPLPVFVAGDDWSLSHVLEMGHRAREHAAEFLSASKQHAISLYVRATDPAVLAGGPRPGVAAVAVAGTLALGGGAYTAYEAVAPSRAPTAASAPSSKPPVPRDTSRPNPVRPVVAPRSLRRLPAQPRATPEPVTPAPQPPIRPSPTTTPPTTKPTNPPPTPTPTEFGFED